MSNKPVSDVKLPGINTAINPPDYKLRAAVEEAVKVLTNTPGTEVILVGGSAEDLVEWLMDTAEYDLPAVHKFIRTAGVKVPDLQ